MPWESFSGRREHHASHIHFRIFHDIPFPPLTSAVYCPSPPFMVCCYGETGNRPLNYTFPPLLSFVIWARSRGRNVMNFTERVLNIVSWISRFSLHFSSFFDLVICYSNQSKQFWKLVQYLSRTFEKRPTATSFLSIFAHLCVGESFAGFNGNRAFCRCFCLRWRLSFAVVFCFEER